MAIFIDKRPKLDKSAINTASIFLAVFILCQIGWRTDYVEDIAKEVPTKVTIKKKDIETYNDKPDYYIYYTIGEDNGRIKVTKDTYSYARSGESKWFHLSKTEYNNTACWTQAILIVLTLASVLSFLISFFFFVTPSIIKRYF